MTSLRFGPEGAEAVAAPASAGEERRQVGSLGVLREEPPGKPRVTATGPLIFWYRAFDPAIAVVLLITVFLLVNARNMPGGLQHFVAGRMHWTHLLLLGLFTFYWPVLFHGAGLYSPPILASVRREVTRLVLACGVGAGVAAVFPLSSESGAFRFTVLLYFWPTAVLGTFTMRRAVRVLARPGRMRRQVLIVGSGPRAYRLYRELVGEAGGPVDVVGFVDTNEFIAFEEIRRRRIGELQDLEGLLMERAVDEVLIALPARSRYAAIQDVLVTCERMGVEAKYLADVFQSWLGRPRYDAASRPPVVAVKLVADDFRLVIKRAIDVVGALVGLIVTAPLLSVIALAVKLTSRGPVIFAQQRYGLNRKLFRMYKFRTMVAAAESQQAELERRNEAAGPVFKIRADPRVTALGRWLRRASLDELPQLVNVLRGEMSLVGPRPLPMRDVNNFDEAWLMRRFSIMPGLTGLWQISGRSNLSFAQWIALDLQYIDHWSLKLDLKILLRTVPVVFKGTGAS